MPEVSIVNALPEAGHPLKSLFEIIADDVRIELTKAYDAKLRAGLKDDFPTALNKLNGALETSRYPFEPNKDIKRYSLRSLVGIVKFLREFVHTMPTKEFVEA
jgi:hypothetical protein